MDAREDGAAVSGSAGSAGRDPRPATRFGVLVGARADADPVVAASLAVLADRLGYRELMIGESTGHDAFALAASLGSGEASVCLGPLPAAVRDPVTVSRGAASVAALTGRTVGVVIGASTSAVVEEWHGRSRADSATIVAECAAVLRGPQPGSGLLAGCEVDFAGALVRTRGFAGALPASHAPLSVLAFGPELIDVAVARADRVVLPIGTVEHIARLRGGLQLDAERTERAVPRLALWVPAAVDPDESARRELMRGLVPYLRAPGFSGMFTEAGFGEVVRLARSGAHLRSVVAAAPPDLLDAVAAVGTIEQVRAALTEYMAVGVDDVILVPHDPTTLEALAA